VITFRGGASAAHNKPCGTKAAMTDKESKVVRIIVFSFCNLLFAYLTD
jgi:hypothetical protein